KRTVSLGATRGRGGRVPNGLAASETPAAAALASRNSRRDQVGVFIQVLPRVVSGTRCALYHSDATCPGVTIGAVSHLHKRSRCRLRRPSAGYAPPPRDGRR